MNLVSNSSQQFIVIDEETYLQMGRLCLDSPIIPVTNESSCAIINPIEGPTINYQNVTDVIYRCNKFHAVHFQSEQRSVRNMDLAIYILAAMLGAFLIIIVVLIIFILILMIRKPQRNNVDRPIKSSIHALDNTYTL